MASVAQRKKILQSTCNSILTRVLVLHREVCQIWQRGMLLSTLLTSSLLWKYKGRDRQETVEQSEKYINSAIEIQLQRIIQSNVVQPSNVKSVQAVVGGTMATQPSNMEWQILQLFTMVSGYISFRKDSGPLFDDTILPKLTSGLRIISTKPLYLYSNNDSLFLVPSLQNFPMGWGIFICKEVQSISRRC